MIEGKVMVAPTILAKCCRGVCDSNQSKPPGGNVGVHTYRRSPPKAEFRGRKRAVPWRVCGSPHFGLAFISQSA
jgi:hypothetical protein